MSFNPKIREQAQEIAALRAQLAQWERWDTSLLNRAGREQAARARKAEAQIAALAAEREAEITVLDAYNELKEAYYGVCAERDRLAEVLTELRDAVKQVPQMNAMKYDALGVKVNRALASLTDKEPT